MENIHDCIAWGRVKVQGREFILLSHRPYHSEIAEGKVGRSIWQIEGTLKWEVADPNGVEYADKEDGSSVVAYQRSLIIFGSDALLEFYQDPKIIKVKYIIPEDDE